MAVKYYIYEGDLSPAVVNYASGAVAIDTESMGLNYYKRDRLCLVQLSFGDDVAHLVRFKPGEYNAPNLVSILENDKIIKIFHYARFDVGIMKQYLGAWTNNIFCTKIASKLVRTYTNSHSLKTLCYDLLDVKLQKQSTSSDWGADSLTADQLSYAAEDVLYLHKLMAILKTMLEREGRLELAQECFNFIKTRVTLDLSGWMDNDILHHGSGVYVS